MKRSIWFVLIMLLPLFAFGCGKGKETTAHKEGMQHEAKAATTQKPGATEMDEMKGMSMESIQKQGKMEEVAAGTKDHDRIS